MKNERQHSEQDIDTINTLSCYFELKNVSAIWPQPAYELIHINLNSKMFCTAASGHILLVFSSDHYSASTLS